MGATEREQIINIGCKFSDFAELHVEDSAMGTGEMEVYGLWVQIGCNFEMYKNKKPCKC